MTEKILILTFMALVTACSSTSNIKRSIASYSPGPQRKVVFQEGISLTLKSFDKKSNEKSWGATLQGEKYLDSKDDSCDITIMGKSEKDLSIIRKESVFSARLDTRDFYHADGAYFFSSGRLMGDSLDNPSDFIQFRCYFSNSENVDEARFIERLRKIVRIE